MKIAIARARDFGQVAEMNNDHRLTPLAASLPASVPFVGPEAQERARGAKFTARLGANECGFGPSPRAVKAMQDAASEAWMYADPESHDLRKALAQSYDIPPECLVIGEGIDGLLGNLVRLFVASGDAVVTSEGAYPTFNYHVAGYGGALAWSRRHAFSNVFSDVRLHGENVRTLTCGKTTRSACVLLL